MARSYEPIPRFHHISAQVANKIVVYSGWIRESLKQSRNRLASTVEVFDPHSEQWEAKQCTGVTPVPGVCRTASVAVNNHLYSFGGIVEDRGIVNSLHKLNARTYKWCELTPQIGAKDVPPMPKTGAAMVASGDNLALFGGLGIPQDTTQRGSSFINGGIYDGSGWTNEFHIYHLGEGTQSLEYRVCHYRCFFFGYMYAYP